MIVSWLQSVISGFRFLLTGRWPGTSRRVLGLWQGSEGSAERTLAQARSRKPHVPDGDQLASSSRSRFLIRPFATASSAFGHPRKETFMRSSEDSRTPTWWVRSVVRQCPASSCLS